MSSQRPPTRVALMRRLERCAAKDKGIAVLMQQEAQDLLSEIRWLQANLGFRIEQTEHADATFPPPEPTRPGQQFEGGAGTVWTWTGYRLVRERDGEGDDVCAWQQAWALHGPLHPLPDLESFGKVALRAQLVVNGRRLQATAMADEFAWEMYPPEAHAHLKADVRRRLVEGIVAELDPPVVVQRAPRRVREWEKQASWRFMPPAAAKKPAQPLPDPGDLPPHPSVPKAPYETVDGVAR